MDHMYQRLKVHTNSTHFTQKLPFLSYYTQRTDILDLTQAEQRHGPYTNYGNIAKEKSIPKFKKLSPNSSDLNDDFVSTIYKVFKAHNLISGDSSLVWFQSLDIYFGRPNFKKLTYSGLFRNNISKIYLREPHLSKIFKHVVQERTLVQEVCEYPKRIYPLRFKLEDVIR